MYKSTAPLSCSLVSKHVFVGEEDGKFDGCDVSDGGVDGAKLKLIDGMVDKVIDDVADVSAIATSVLGDESSGTKYP
eukprot:CAMPEP_0196218474 /NCGR_PEP_ID=MMETSP0912-20130531/36625_1 /TAXON_ID=49265 /ORGANISM="Thalassiosira rotula, Strain GSO102" /LENGTH=76 /DNA_ID=CAMNT_0041496157 /DNA_START=70 /DNA_END=297 /DNA_ORIENTATION=+